MRQQLAILFTILSAVACGPPDVTLPSGNEHSDSDYKADNADLTAPTMENVPRSYPYGKIALHGTAPHGVRVLVEGAGNPFVGPVNPQKNEFCVELDLITEPAHYTLTVRSQGPDGALSAPTKIQIDHSKDAPVPDGATLCDGTPIGN